jgi:hypothetical protein
MTLRAERASGDEATPRLHRDVPLRGDRGVQVDAADDVVVGWVEDSEGESGASREVIGVAAEVGEVLFERQATGRRPAAVGVAGSGAGMCSMLDIQAA